MSLKAALFGSSYKWGHMVSPTADKKSQPRPPCSTDRRRIFVWPLGQPLWPRGRPCHLYHRKEKHEYTWTCLGKRILCWSRHVYTIGAWAAPGRIYTTGPELHLPCLDKRILCWSGYVYTIGTWAAPGGYLHHKGQSCTCLVWTKGFCAGLDMSTPLGPELHPDVSTPQGQSCTCHI